MKTYNQKTRDRENNRLSVRICEEQLRLAIVAFAMILFAVGLSFLIPTDVAHAEGEWYEDYDYALNSSAGTITLRTYTGAGGEITVPGSATIDGITYRTVLNGSYGGRPFNMKESVTGIEFLSGITLPASCAGMFSGCKNLAYIIFPADLDTSHVTSMSSMFQNCKALTTLDITMLDTSGVQDFSHMFSYCTGLTSVDLTGFDTSGARSVRSMFEGCSALEAVDLTHFNTSNVTDFGGMFYGCSALKSIDVTHFQTGNAVKMSSMFQACSSLEAIDLHSFDTSRVTEMNLMFCSCGSLKELDLSGFNTENVTMMEQMFSGCLKLEKLDISSFKTDHVTTMKSMFSNLFAMTELDVSHFNTENVTNMYSMFNGVRNSSLDVSGFNTAKVTDMRIMFSNMINLTAIDLSGFDMSAATMTSNLFSSCTSLVEIKTPGVKPVISTPITGTVPFAEKDEAGYYKDERYTDFLDAPASTTIYRVDTYEIAFYANSGVGTMESIDAQCGVPVALPPCTFTRDGYYFAGWSTTYAAPSTDYEDGAEVTDLTRRNQIFNLYARWRRIASFSVALPAMLGQTVDNGAYYNEIMEINVAFSGNTGDYLKITPSVTDLTDGKGVTIPMRVSISTDTFRNGGGDASIWVRSTSPLNDLPSGDYTGTLSVTFQSVYN